MIFNSYTFLIFFPIVCFIYFILPNKYNLKNIWLLFTSYYFYCFYNVKYALIIFSVTFISYIGGIIIKKYKKQKLFLILSIAILSMIFFTFKFLNNFINFLALISNNIFNESYLKEFDIVLPVGISFYTLQAIAYIVDIYKKKIECEKNFIKYALYISFFPQLVAGPIEKAGSFISQINVPKKFEYNRMKKGLLIMTAGFFQKLVIADRAAIFVNSVYDNINNCYGITIVIATLLFGLQVYCDFAGYSNIAIGAAEVLGFKLTKNFNMPYMSTSISEFWNRWHMTFSTWLKDYIYIPLGGNKCSKIRNYFNLLFTFVVSGLWHGSSMNFVIWGAINGIFIVIDKILKSLNIKLPKFISWLITYIAINFTWLFFRAKSLDQIKNIFVRITNNFNIQNINEICYLYGEKIEFLALIIAVLIMFFINLINSKNDILGKIFKMNIVIRWILYYSIIFSIIIFGIYGVDIANTKFIYFQF